MVSFHEVQETCRFLLKASRYWACPPVGGSNQLKTRQEPGSSLMGPASKHPSNSWNAPGVAAHLRNVAERDDVFMLLEGKILSTKVRGNFRRPSSLTPPRRAAYVSCHFPGLKVLTGGPLCGHAWDSLPRPLRDLRLPLRLTCLENAFCFASRGVKGQGSNHISGSVEAAAYSGTNACPSTPAGCVY